MALPPWTVELLRRGVQDLARQATDPETTAAIKQQAAKLVEELPRVARERVDTLLKQAESSTQPLRDAWNQGDLFSGFNWNLADTAGVPIRLINGSGILMHPQGCGVPYSPTVQAAAVPFLSGDVSVVPEIEQRLNGEIASRFTTESGEASKVSAFVAPSLSDALATVNKLGRRGGGLFVPRCDSWRQVSSATGQDGLTLVESIRRRNQGSVCEFGKPSEDGPVDVSEVLRALERKASHGNSTSNYPSTSAVVRFAGTDLASSQMPESVLKIVVISAGTLGLAGDGTSLPDVQAELHAGADVVVLSGGVLCGTPSVGIVIGRSEVMSRLNGSGVSRPRTASIAETAMVAAAVSEQAQSQSPVARLLKVSEENLRDRAERLATQISGASFTQSVRVTDQPAHITSDISGGGSDPGHTVASRQVVIKTEQTNELARRLRSANVAILTTEIGGDLAIDLRWMTPDQQSIVASRFA